MAWSHSCENVLTETHYNVINSAMRTCIHKYTCMTNHTVVFLFKNMLHAGKVPLHRIHFYSNRLILPRQWQRLVILWKRRKCEYDLNFSCVFISLSGSSLVCRADPRLVPSQWQTSLFSNAVSHWLGASLESALGLACILDPNFVSTVSADIDALAHNSAMSLTGTVPTTTQTYFRQRFPWWQRYRINICWPNDVIQNGRQVLADLAILVYIIHGKMYIQRRPCRVKQTMISYMLTRLAPS